MATTRSLPLCIAALCAATVLLSAADSGKQKIAPYALIFGTVYDQDQRPVYGIRVKIARLKNGKKEKSWELVSDHRGEFAQRVPAGAADYVVWPELKPANPATSEVKVRIENDERQDISLHLTTLSKH